ncbi:MAG TPA: GNAT family N-acetyltransferase [Marmoricola sp.]|nr:GNAT family N-acetyltransferase [Marmoricola sp.]
MGGHDPRRQPARRLAIARLHAARQGTDGTQASARVAGWLGRSDKIVLVAQHRKDVVGYVTASLLDPEAAGVEAPRGWYPTGVVVDPRCPRPGVGRRLTAARLEALEGVASEVW